MMVGLVTAGCLLPRRAVGFSQVCRRWFFGLATGLRPTVRAADTASPWASRGSWSGKNPLLAVVVGRRRRAADAIVGREGERRDPPRQVGLRTARQSEPAAGREESGGFGKRRRGRLSGRRIGPRGTLPIEVKPVGRDAVVRCGAVGLRQGFGKRWRVRG